MQKSAGRDAEEGARGRGEQRGGGEVGGRVERKDRGMRGERKERWEGMKEEGRRRGGRRGGMRGRRREGNPSRKGYITCNLRKE